MLTDAIKQDITALLEVVRLDEASIAKLMKRKHGVRVTVVDVRKFQAERDAIADQAPETEEETQIVVEEVRSQAPSKSVVSAEDGSKRLLAAICRLAIKQDKLLPGLTPAEQIERARADGYNGPLEGAPVVWA